MLMTERDARARVADDWRNLAYLIRADIGGDYATHVTPSLKDEILHKHLDYADDIQSGAARDFTCQQRVHHYMTGECVALLS